MSQLNLKQILSGDNLSTVVEKLNYNFNQILLNGGGPRGLRGLLGAPGLPGSQGIQGLDGPKGETGTQLYTASGATPGSYPFGTGGEMLPRTGDVFISTDPSSLTIWELSPTGTSNFWNLVETILPPGSGSKLIYDAVQFNNETFTSFTNDPDISGKLLIGSTDALTNNFLIDPGFPTRLRPELSSAVPFGDSLSIFASSRNQIRILNSSNDINSIGSTGGGVVHSLETLGANSIYKIVHADSVGNKHFSIKLNGGVTSLPSLFYANTDNRLGIGVPEFTPLIATAVINGGLAVGSAANSFYLSSNGANLQNSLGAIIEGNVSIGRNKNNFATLGVYNRPGVTNNSSIVIDSNLVTSSSVSSLTLGGGLYNDNVASTNNGYSWSFRTISQTNIASYRDLRLDATVPGSARTALSVLAPNNNDRVKVGVDNTTPYGLLEIGPQESTFSRVSIGDIPLDATGNTEEVRSYMGFNWHRNPSQLAGVPWRRYGSPTTALGVSRSGAAIWNSANGLGISIIGGTPGTSSTNNDSVFINSHAFFIDYDKNVGINTLTPQSKLDIDVGTSNTSLSSGNSILRLSGGIPTYQGFFAINGTSFQIGQNSDIRSLTIHSGSGMPERMRVTPDGKVGVGTGSPSTRLSVYDEDITDVEVLRVSSNGGPSGTQGKSYIGLDFFSDTGTRISPVRIGVEQTTQLSAINYISGTNLGAFVIQTRPTNTPNLLPETRLAVVPNGNVGIGTISPTRLLHVDGTARIDSLTVGSNSAPPPTGLRVLGACVLSTDSSLAGVSIGTTTGAQSRGLRIRGATPGSSTPYSDGNIVIEGNGGIATTAVHLDFDKIGGSGNAVPRFFRNTDTTGDKLVQFYAGNNTSAIHAQIGCGNIVTQFGRGGGDVELYHSVRIVRNTRDTVGYGGNSSWSVNHSGNATLGVVPNLNSNVAASTGLNGLDANNDYWFESRDYDRTVIIEGESTSGSGDPRYSIEIRFKPGNTGSAFRTKYLFSQRSFYVDQITVPAGMRFQIRWRKDGGANWPPFNCFVREFRHGLAT